MAANVRPELVEHDPDSVVSHLGAPYRGGVRKSLIGCRMIAIGRDGCSHPAPQDFAVVEGIVSGIRTRNEETAQSVTGAMHESSFAQLIIPRIGAHDGGNNGVDHIILNQPVREG